MSQRSSRCPQCGRAHRGHEASCPPADLAPAAPQAAPPPASPALVEADRRALLGRVLQGRYRVAAVLGEGGMGTVYEAEHLLIGRPVALKVLHPDFGRESEAVRRFRHEARAAGSIGHPNICEIYDVGKLDDGSPFLVMERLHGETLADRIERETALPLADVVDVALQVLSALAAAHEKGIVHRDVKPDNIFLAERAGYAPLVKLLDFGISKNAALDDLRMTRTGAVMGTPYYMAPEQARGEAIDARIDLYAVGAVLYESLTGQRPFEANELAELLRQVLFEAPRPLRALRPSLPEPFELVVRRALAKERTERYQTAQELMAALAALRVELAAFRPNPGELDRLVQQVRPATPPHAPQVTSPPPAPLAGRLNPLPLAPSGAAPSPLAGQTTPGTPHALRGAAPRLPAPPPAAARLPAPPRADAARLPGPAPGVASPATAPPFGVSGLPPHLPQRGPTFRNPSSLPPPPSPNPRLPAPPLARPPSTIPPAPTPRPASPTPRQEGPQVVVLPPGAPLPGSLPGLTPRGGAAAPYRPQRTALPPPRPPTPQGHPRAELRPSADAGVVPPPPHFMPGAATPPPALGPERGALPAPPTAQAQRPQQPLPPPPAGAPKPLVRPNDVPKAWHEADDDELPTRLYDPKRDHAARARSAKVPKKEH